MTSRLRAEAIEMRYPGMPAPLIADLTLHVPDGKVTTIIGPNGCGKSTVLRALGRSMRPAGGSVVLDGELIHRLPAKEVARRLGVLHQQHETVEGLTVVDLVRRGRYAHQGFLQPLARHDVHAVEAALDRADMSDLRDRQMDQLSGGQRQRAWIAMVLAQETALLLLDEPTTFLDLAHRREVIDLVHRLHATGATVLMVLHDVNEAARASDHLVALRDGRILAAGPPRDVVTPELLLELYGVTCDIVVPPGGGQSICIPVSRHDLRGDPPAADGHGVRIEALTTGYAARTPVSRELSLDLPAGRIVSIVGPNACGKSTLLRTGGRLLEPLGGSFRVAGQDVRHGSRRALARRLATVTQGVPAAPGFLVEDIVAAGRMARQSVRRQWSRDDARAIAEALDRRGIADLRYRRVETLSGGERQRTWIAMALAQDTPFLFLDEPTTFLDLRYQIEILDLVHGLNRDHGRTIVMVLHDLDLAARYADVMVVMQEGDIVAAGHPTEIVTPGLIARAFSIKADVIVDPRTSRPLVLPRTTSRDTGAEAHPPPIASMVDAHRAPTG